MNKPSNNGGAVAIRGFLVQTMVALLDIAQADPPFIDITMEPIEGQDQFDFTWCDASVRFAVQVKSSDNQFSLPDATRWATALQQARCTAQSKAQCKLILVGHFHAKLQGRTQIDTPHGAVALQQKNLDLDGLLREAAHLLGAFMDTHHLHAGSAAQRLLTVKSLIGQMLLGSTNSSTMSRDEFIAFLIACIGKAAQQQVQPLPHDVDRITRYAPTHLIGREAETALLASAWQQVCDNTSPRPHILSFVALGGEGKTSVVADWVAQQEQVGWPGCEAAFAWSFYSQGTEQQAAASSDLFIHAALQFFGETALAASNQSGVDKARRLAQVVGERRVLLILDGVEPLQYPPTGSMRGALKDQALAQLLRGLAGHSLGLCVLTTRYAIPDLNKHCWRNSVKEHKLLRLSNAAGVSLLGELKVHGAPAECAKLVESVQGHALSIHLFGSYLRDAHGGDIRKRDRVHLAEANTRWRCCACWACSTGPPAQTASPRCCKRQ